MEKYNDMIENLRGLNWLDNIGKSIDMNNIEQVSDFNQMILLIESDEWSNYVINKIGDLTAYLTKYHKERGKNWNNIVKYIKTNYITELDNLLLSKGMEKKSVRDDITYNVINIIMADYYSDMYTDQFWNTIYSIYSSGHIVCGFDTKRNVFLVY